MQMNFEALSRAATEARGLCMDAVQASQSGHLGLPVGCAVVCKMPVARFNTAEHRIFDQHVICLAGDGCMQEGVSSEPNAFTGHFGLDNLILIYDSNAVTLDAPATATQSEDTGARFKAYGFDVQEINGEDMQAFLDALNNAKENNNGRPKFIISHSLIGKGIPEVAGTYKAHGEAGAKFVDA